ncbi:MAG: hypothetical protein ACRC3G_07095, partial [Bacteroidales bacterium]
MKSDFAGTVCKQIMQLAKCNKSMVQCSTPFRLIEVPEKQLTFHLIDLPTYLEFEQSTDCSSFFADLSTLFTKHNIQLIHLWEDIWHTKPQQVEARLSTLLGNFNRYHARQTKVCQLTSPQLLAFLQKHHFQVPLDGTYKYGLFLNNEIVAVASFSRGCIMKQKGDKYRSHELLRFANATNSIVAGGLSKLLVHFIREHIPS